MVGASLYFHKFVKIINTKTITMKKLLLSTVLVLALSLTFTSCRDTEKKADDMGDTIEKAADDVADETEGALEKAGKAIDNAAKEVKEAGKAVDSAANQVVGDDN